MKKLLTGKAGVTVLEGVIALGLLALVAGGAFGVLLSASRQTTQPDIKEEMAWAVETVNTELKAYIGVSDATKAPVPSDLRGGLCRELENTTNPLSAGSPHNITCKLPLLCDKNQSSFTYTVNNQQITYTIRCNGYNL